VPTARELLDLALTAVPGAQAREGQHQMVEAVAEALASGRHLLVQAGTGTGKSLGYLVPALASGRRVVVATATKALQAQLVEKDLPRLVDALAPALGRTPTFALAKGRSNYACLQRLHGADSAAEDGQDALWDGPTSMTGQQVLRLREWAQGAATGDRDEVPFPVNDRAWRQVSVSARECLGTRCPDRVDCFAERARERARDVDVVVANHALLALDAFSEAQVLPEHDAVVLDEAHEFPASATEALTLELTAPAVRRAAAGAREFVSEATHERLEDAHAVLDGALHGVESGWLPSVPDPLVDALGVVETACGAAMAEIGKPPEGTPELEVARRDRAKQALSELATAAAALRTPPERTAVYATQERALRVSPLAVGGTLARLLFEEVTVVATSATLTLGGSFGHTAVELGLPWPPHGWEGVDVGSPFDYGRQGQLWVARDLPDPSKQAAAWQEAVDRLCVELLQAAGGRTLALFTSSAAAARAAAAVRAATDLPVLLQGEDTPGALTRRFAADTRTCLFGTRSFWQGVDVPGPSCQLVILDRIPFAFVDDPLVKARQAEAGERAFMQVTLPPAAVLLAQGAGRLIRSTTDRGVVVVLDPRLVTARYGEVLLRTLPGFYRAGSLEAVLASLRAIDADVTGSAPPTERS
jgi:ATP-dependent DNA helicase DinG